MNRPLFSIVFLAGAILAAFFFTWPAVQDLQFLELEKRSKIAEFENRQAYFANLASLQMQLKDFEPQLAKLNSALPEDTSLPSLYQLLQEISAGSGLVLKSISAQVLQKESPVKTIDLQLRVAGSYESLKKFLKNTQSAWRLISIDSVTFVSPSPEASAPLAQKTGPSFEVSLRMQAYSY